ncbi:HAD family hydrolase [Lacticaseibacillus porcinae]|uniref:HAD family hydrolase n=1 Tax=Lacticaseibacillus porcinae TaxID=1123687 RepID=UPI000F7922C8|nr:hypothetical protein [Lacticaseibacillus porcinae]
MSIRSKLHLKLDNFESCTPEKLIGKADNFEYVSFDIFDTLLKRDVPIPTDLFVLMQEKNHIENFAKRRINAEARARQLSPSGEVNLEDIYAQFDDTDGQQKLELISAEKELEVEVAIANPEMASFYDYCKNNKKIVLISDMYLDRETITRLLTKCGISGFQRLYISNELNLSKAEGALFDYVVRNLKINRNDILHIGNSFRADFVSARKHGISSVKIRTYYNLKLHEYYKPTDTKSADATNFLEAFLNNHTLSSNDYFSQFGYEAFGPLLYGFSMWLADQLRKDNVKQVFFLARDGYIMKRAFECLGFDKDFEVCYFEASRRSLRIPAYHRDMSLDDILGELTVPNMTNISQIFDSLGLDVTEYLEEIQRLGFDQATYLKRDSLSTNKMFLKLLQHVYTDVMINADAERADLIGYLNQHDFNKKTALVDIGWGGSMQKYLLETLQANHFDANIVGYYVGLTAKAKSNLGKYDYSARGYVFDNLHHSGKDLERPFVGLFETLFLEQSGSVKRYIQSDQNFVALRYPYEYSVDDEPTPEAVHVGELQERALEFIEDFSNSPLREFVGKDSITMFNNLQVIGVNPSMKDVNAFGDFQFFNNSQKVYLAKPSHYITYLVHPHRLVHDLFDSQWKTGFLKRLLRLNIPYQRLFDVLRRASN